jgi:hypothetical protein
MATQSELASIEKERSVVVPAQYKSSTNGMTTEGSFKNLRYASTKKNLEKNQYSIYQEDEKTEEINEIKSPDSRERTLLVSSIVTPKLSDKKDKKNRFSLVRTERTEKKERSIYDETSNIN